MFLAHDKDHLHYYESHGKSSITFQRAILKYKYMLKNVYKVNIGVFLVVFFPCMCVPVCEEIHSLISEVFNFFQSHGRMSYMASNFAYLEVIATYTRQHSKLGSCGQIPVFHH